MATLTNSSNTTSDGIKAVGYDMGTKIGHYVALIDTSGNVISSLPVTNSAGTAIMGKVGIDQTTPGTTNAIVPKNSSGTELFTSENPGQVTVNGSLAQVDTVINAQSVAAGAAISANLNITGREKEVWLMINIDKQPWTILATPISYLSGTSTAALYPKFVSSTNTYSESYAPAICLYMGISLFTPTSFSDAKNYIMYGSSGTISIRNESAATATVTVRVIRVWR